MNPQTVQNVVTYDTVIEFDNPDQKLLPGMTAYVTIPVAEARNVLKIPNGAVRFRLEEPERRALFAKYNFQERGGGTGRGFAPAGQAGTGRGDGGAGAGGGQRASGGGGENRGGGGRRGGGGAGGGAEGSARGGGRGGAAAADIHTVYVLQPDKTLRPVVVRTGITDYAFTEVAAVLQGELKPGEELVTGKELPNRGVTGFMGGPMGGMGRGFGGGRPR